MQTVGYEFVLNHCVFSELLNELLIINLGMQDIFTFIKKKKKRKKKKQKFEFLNE
jgi:hypothetical protein